MEDVLSLPLVHSKEEKKEPPKPPNRNEGIIRFLALIIALTFVRVLHKTMYKYAVQIGLPSYSILGLFFLGAIAIHLMIPFVEFFNGDWVGMRSKVKTVFRWMYSISSLGTGLAYACKLSILYISLKAQLELSRIFTYVILIGLLIFVWGRAAIFLKEHLILLVVLYTFIVLGSFYRFCIEIH